MALEDRLEEMREKGWMVVCHNDYIQNGVLMTFWSFARGSRYVKGEGIGDHNALDEVMSAINNLPDTLSSYVPEPLKAERLAGLLVRFLKRAGNGLGHVREVGQLARVTDQWPEYITAEPVPARRVNVAWKTDGADKHIQQVPVEDLEFLGSPP